jgi:hypothetical protein
MLVSENIPMPHRSSAGVTAAGFCISVVISGIGISAVDADEHFLCRWFFIEDAKFHFSAKVQIWTL